VGNQQLQCELVSLRNARGFSQVELSKQKQPRVISMTNHIPVYQAALAGNEKQYVNECLDTTWISSKGRFVSLFEDAFADYLRIGHATAVNNGTTALHLALHTLGIGAGDEVIVPTLTYIASVNAIAFVGATPVFVDADPNTWSIDVGLIESKITPRTKAILVVHLYGAVCAMDELMALCKKRKLLLIEDVAEAFGSQYRGKYAGSFGNIATFSFYGNKTITTGEGGMVVSNDGETIARAAHLKSQAVSPVREYWHDEIGFNFRMTNICAAIGLAQLERADDIIKAKRTLASWYREELDGTGLTIQPELPGTVHTYWMVSVLARDAALRDRIRAALSEEGVETRPLFFPAHTMPMFKTNEVFPVAADLSGRGMNLPSFPALAREQVRFIGGVIRKAVVANPFVSAGPAGCAHRQSHSYST
jgi:perosamine synthetase